MDGMGEVVDNEVEMEESSALPRKKAPDVVP